MINSMNSNLYNQMKSQGSFETKAFKQLPIGGYICVIKGVKQSNNYPNALEMLVDIASGEYESYFEDAYKRTNYWLCTKTQDFVDQTKWGRFLTSLEHSNPSWKYTTDEKGNFNEQSLKGLYIGLVFRGKERIDKLGNVQVLASPDYFVSVKRIQDGDFTIRETVKLESKQNTTNKNQNAFGMTMDISSDALPF